MRVALFDAVSRNPSFLFSFSGYRKTRKRVGVAEGLEFRCLPAGRSPIYFLSKRRSGAANHVGDS
jgi:hypothetical protein